MRITDGSSLKKSSFAVRKALGSAQLVEWEASEAPIHACCIFHAAECKFEAMCGLSTSSSGCCLSIPSSFPHGSDLTTRQFELHCGCR